ncbi:MAG: type II secretion system protein [Peptoanaerobacter stomatis]
MRGRLKAFTLIEIICAISLLLLVMTSLMSITVYTLKSVKEFEADVEINQISDNLEYYIKKELKPDRISFIDCNKDEYMVHYQSFTKEGTGNKYKFSDKKLRFVKENSSIMLDTQNDYYIKNGANYIKDVSKEQGSNIIEENIREVKTEFKDSTLYFEIVVFSGEKEQVLKFSIKGLETRKFLK